MISLSPIIALLAPVPVGFDGLWFRKVEGAGAYAQVDASSIPTPTAWVIRAADKVEHWGERSEKVMLGFDVVIAIENARVHTPGETDDMLLNYRLAVKNILLGWEIKPDIKPLVFDGGRPLRYAEGDLVWADHYSFEALIDNYLPDPAPFEELVYTGDKL